MATLEAYYDPRLAALAIALLLASGAVAEVGQLLFGATSDLAAALP